MPEYKKPKVIKISWFLYCVEIRCKCGEFIEIRKDTYHKKDTCGKCGRKYNLDFVIS